MIDPQTRPQIIVVSESNDFRRMARKKITSEDVFLEIGCSFGECTRILGELGCSGVALDNSESVVAKAVVAVATFSGISVVQADARDMAHIHSLCPSPSVILFDVGGNEQLDKVTSLLRLVLQTFRPRLLLVRSMELAELSSLIEDYYLPNCPHLLAPLENAAIPHQLLGLSHSPVVTDRLFALQKLRDSARQSEVRARIKEMRHDENKQVRKLAKHVLHGYESEEN